MSAPRPVPASLRRRGITRVTDNLSPDCRVRLPAGAFYTWFGAPLLERLEARAEKASPNGVSQGEDHAD